MNERLQGVEQRRLDEIVQWADDEFGTDALYAFVQPKTKQVLLARLRDVLPICGSHIAAQDQTASKETLRKWHEMAIRMKTNEKYHALYDLGIELGQRALAKHGIAVGESSERAD